MILSKNLLLLFFSGISAVTLIDTLGAIASRKFNFKYEILALFFFFNISFNRFFWFENSGSK
jgi:hypothetical protein